MQTVRHLTSYKYNHMQAGFMSSSEDVHPIAAEAGMAIFPLQAINKHARASTQDTHTSGWPDPQETAQRVMQIFGSALKLSAPTTDAPRLHDWGSEQQDEIDLLVMHVAQPETGQQLSHAAPADQSHNDSNTGLQNRADTSHEHKHIDQTLSTSITELYTWLNQVVCCLLADTTFKQSVLLVLLLQNPSNLDIHSKSDPVVSAAMGKHGFPSISKPLQSHCVSNMQKVPQCQSSSSLMVQYMPAVVRVPGKAARCKAWKAVISALPHQQSKTTGGTKLYVIVCTSSQLKDDVQPVSCKRWP